MTDWMEQAQNAVALAVCAVMDYDPNGVQAADFIRFTMREDSTSPQPSRLKDVVYITMSHGNGTFPAYTATSDGSMNVTKQIPVQALLTFYGPNSASFAEYARTRLLSDFGPGCPRDILRQNNMVLTFPIDAPVSAPELEDGNWRKRSDLRLNLMQTVTDTFTTQTVTTAPEIRLNAE